VTKRTEQKDLFLAALRGDAAAQRTCTKAGKPCGGRCIPKHWNCRIKGEGDTPPTRGNKVQLSAQQKEKIAKVRRSRRIRAVGAVAAIAGGAAVVGALSAKNPQKSRRLFKKGPGVAGALGVAGVIPGPTRKAALGGNLGLAGAHAAGAMGANFGQNKRGRKLYAQHFTRLKNLERQVNKLEPKHIRLNGKLTEAKKLVEAANNQLKNKGTSKYALNNATRSIAQQDRIRKQNVKSAYGSLRKANADLNAFEKQTGFRKVKAEYTRTLKATTKIKSILLKPYKTKDVVGGVLNDYRASYLKGYNYARRQIRGIGVAQARRGPRANSVPFYERKEFQADSADTHHRADKKCGKSAIPDKWKCTKAVQVVAENQGEIAAVAIYAGAAGVSLGAGLLAARNARIRGRLKFGGNDRITPYGGTIGDADGILKNFRSTKGGGASMFGDVLIGKSGDKNVVVKKITGSKNKVDALLDPVAQMKKEGLIDDVAESNLLKQRNSLMENEVNIAQAAGELGFGPKVLAAKKNTLIMEVAEGKPLLGSYTKAGGIPTAKELSTSDKKLVLASMAKMHTGGIAHNDMHLGNTFTGSKGAQFIDFGTSQRGGGPVAMEFVRQMNPPRYGEGFIQGGGYNLKTLDRVGYSKTERQIKKAIGKRVGTLRDNDIAKAVAKNPKLGGELQTIVDNYYLGLSGSRSDSASRVDKKCGNSGIPDNAKCSKKNTARTVAKVAATAALVAGGVVAVKNRGRIQRRFRKTGLTPYQKEQLKKMRAKGTGKYGAQGKRSFTSEQKPFYSEADRIYPVKHKRLFRDAEAADAEGKKYSKTVTDPKTGRKRTVKYGAKGYTIAPGTKRGNSYCARSFGDMKSHNKNCAGKDRNTPLCLSRAKWKCSGKTSR
jgi:hypothetical protein